MSEIEQDTYNLLDNYKIFTPPGEAMSWCEADEWEADSEMIPELEEGEIEEFTDFPHGDAGIIEDILILYPSKGYVGKDGNADRYREELRQLPLWTQTKYVVVLNHSTQNSDVYYAQSHDTVPVTEADEVLTRLLELADAEAKADK